jgi:hypothetical protein
VSIHFLGVQKIIKPYIFRASDAPVSRVERMRVDIVVNLCCRN